MKKTTRFGRAPNFDIPTCSNCGDPGFETVAWIDRESATIFHMPIGIVPTEPEADPVTTNDAQICLPWPAVEAHDY